MATDISPKKDRIQNESENFARNLNGKIVRRVEDEALNLGFSNFLNEVDGYTTLIDYSSGNIIYIGKALPGSLPSSNVWRIKRIEILSGSIDIKYADSDNLFDNVWDNRTSLVYG